jgi:hypothetical protein
VTSLAFYGCARISEVFTNDSVPHIRINRFIYGI